MKVFAFLLLVGGTVASFARPRHDKVFDIEHAEEHFLEFVKTYNKHYADEAEQQRRFKIFKEHLKDLSEKSLRTKVEGIGITKFSDLTLEEFINNYTGYRGDMKRDASACEAGSKVSSNAPSSFDWRNKRVISKPKAQDTPRECGSCWAFAAIGNIEAQYAMKHSYMLDLSEQQLVDCDRRSHGCNGTNDIGYPFEYLMKSSGSVEEKDYPYVSAKRQCRFDPSKVKVKVTGCVKYRPQSEEELKNILYSVGPLTLGLDARDMASYTSRILPECSFQTINHAVLLVGYGTENDTPYWLIKNSWGEEFGEGGYIRIQRGVNACGLMHSVMIKGAIA